MQKPDTEDGLFHSGNPQTGEKGTPIPIAFLNGLLQISTVFRGEAEPPDPGLGDDNDLYIATPTRNFYDKVAGEWVGPWAQGVAGPDGLSALSGVVDPTVDDGRDGEVWINTATLTLFGPKAGGAWPAGVPMSTQGPQGAAGAAQAAFWADIVDVGVSTVLAGYDVVYRIPAAAAGDVTLTFPTAVGKKGRVIAVKNKSAFNAICQGAGGQTVDDSADGVSFAGGREGWIFMSDGVNWESVGRM